jgi:hypothetical protein
MNSTNAYNQFTIANPDLPWLMRSLEFVSPSAGAYCLYHWQGDASWALTAIIDALYRDTQKILECRSITYSESMRLETTLKRINGYLELKLQDLSASAFTRFCYDLNKCFSDLSDEEMDPFEQLRHLQAVKYQASDCDPLEHISLVELVDTIFKEIPPVDRYAAICVNKKWHEMVLKLPCQANWSIQRWVNGGDHLWQRAFTGLHGSALIKSDRPLARELIHLACRRTEHVAKIIPLIFSNSPEIAHHLLQEFWGEFVKQLDVVLDSMSKLTGNQKEHLEAIASRIDFASYDLLSIRCKRGYYPDALHAIAAVTVIKKEIFPSEPAFKSHSFLTHSILAD